MITFHYQAESISVTCESLRGKIEAHHNQLVSRPADAVMFTCSRNAAAVPRTTIGVQRTLTTVKLQFYELIGTRGVHKIKMFG